MRFIVFVCQVNIMPTGRKKKRSVVRTTSIALLSLIKFALLAEQEDTRSCQLVTLCSATARPAQPTGHQGNNSYKSGALEEIFWRYPL